MHRSKIYCECAGNSIISKYPNSIYVIRRLSSPRGIPPIWKNTRMSSKKLWSIRWKEVGIQTRCTNRVHLHRQLTDFIYSFHIFIQVCGSQVLGESAMGIESFLGGIQQL